MFVNFNYVLGAEFSEVNVNNITVDVAREQAPKILNVEVLLTPTEGTLSYLNSFEAEMARRELRVAISSLQSLNSELDKEVECLSKLHGTLSGAKAERRKAIKKYHNHLKVLRLALIILQFTEDEEDEL